MFSDVLEHYFVVTIKVFHLKYVYEPGNCNQFVKPFLEIRTCSKWHVTHVNVSFKSRKKSRRYFKSGLSNIFIRGVRDQFELRFGTYSSAFFVRIFRPHFSSAYQLLNKKKAC